MAKLSNREMKRKNVDPSQRCMNTTINTRGRKLHEVECPKKATWIVRQDGKLYRLCDSHKGLGILVKKI